jgi:hypothetical protein
VFIVTYGRSGSTLLQGILNSIDGCVVRGENYNFCYGLFAAYKAIVCTKYGFGQGADTLMPSSPWYGASLLDEQRFLDDARHLVLRQMLADEPMPNCIGFKEIRYLEVINEDGCAAQKTSRKFKEICRVAGDGGHDDTELQDYLDFLGTLFPKPAFIFLTREHSQVRQSAWWRDCDSKQVEQQLNKFETCSRKFCDGKENVFSIDFNDIVSRSQRLQDLFAFLGAEYDAAALETVLSTEHSYSAKPKEPDPPEKHGGCRVDYAEMPEEVAFAQLDATAPKRSPNGLYALGGLVVLAPACEQKHFRLLAVDSAGGEYKVIWRMESPFMAKEYPGNPNAERARFRVADLAMQPKQPLALYLEYPTGQRDRLFSIVLP